MLAVVGLLPVNPGALAPGDRLLSVGEGAGGRFL